jgi:transposase
MISLNIPTLQINNLIEQFDFYLFEGQVTFENGNPCPSCHEVSFKTHSYYERIIQDLPMNGKRVELRIKTRKLYCQNDTCTTKYFVQTLEFARASSLKTRRLEDMMLEIAIPISLLQATFILNHLGVKISKSALAEFLKLYPFRK